MCLHISSIPRDRVLITQDNMLKQAGFQRASRIFGRSPRYVCMTSLLLVEDVAVTASKNHRNGKVLMWTKKRGKAVGQFTDLTVFLCWASGKQTHQLPDVQISLLGSAAARRRTLVVDRASHCSTSFLTIQTTAQQSSLPSSPSLASHTGQNALEDWRQVSCRWGIAYCLTSGSNNLFLASLSVFQWTRPTWSKRRRS